MPKITDTTWQIEPHTEAKHAILRKYLEAWLPIMARANGRIIYIDGFAGPGEYIGGHKGSPIIAVETAIKNQTAIKAEIKMIFIEADTDRCESLKHKIEQLTLPPNVKPYCICAKFNETLTEVFKHLAEQKSKLAPAFVFVDPFGFTGIPFSLINKIMSNPKCEILITFMYEEINRFVNDKRLWHSLDETFGTNEWQLMLSQTDSKAREFSLHNIYKKQLEQEANIKFVCSFKMTNRTNKTDYFLFFGTNNIVGLKKMKEAMWKVDESGLFQFSDATYNPSQPTLFEMEPNYNQLKKVILNKFKGKSVNITELENFILTQTPFRETHYKKQILAPMEKMQPPEIKIEYQRNRRQGTFKEDCIVEFL